MKNCPLLFPLLILLAFGCKKAPPQPPPMVIVSGDTAGWIVPCGCTSNQSGGLLRRGTYVEQTRKTGPLTLVDIGGAPSGTTLYDKLKFEAIVQGELAMGISVHNIGHAEAKLGIEELRRLQKTYNIPWVSANTSDPDGKPFAESGRVIESGNAKILFVGILSQDFQGEIVRIAPPKQTVLKTLKEFSGTYDYAVVLAYVPEDELRELAENLPEVDAVLGGPTGQPVPPNYPQGHVLTTSATKQGKFLATLRFPRSNDKTTRIQAEITELDGRFDDDPIQQKNLDQFYAELKRRDLSPKDTLFWQQQFGPVTENYASPKACQSCHEEEYAVWQKSNHAVAWKSLVNRGAHYDPDCQRCHVDGYGRSGGFETVSASSDRFNVGCESCHGPSLEHCQTTSKRTPATAHIKEGCIQCHDKENSPRFDFDEYWTKIRHGGLPED